MKKSPLNIEKYDDAFIKIAQFLGTLTDLKNFWKKIATFFSKYFYVGFFVFLEKDDAGGFETKSTSFNEVIYTKIYENVENTVIQVLDSGVFSSDIIKIPATYCVTLLPISKLKQNIGVILIAQKSSNPLPKRLLNIYLAVAGLIENTLDKLVTIGRMRNYHDYLEEIVKKRTVELEEINKRLESEIIRREKAEEALKKFVSTVTHELRNPITVLTQSINNLNRYKNKITPEIKEKLMITIQRNVKLLSELINDLLVTSRIDAHKIILKWGEYNLSETMNDVLEMMEPRRLTKNIEVENNIDKNLILYGDKQRVGQIFRIFIDNAIKYSPENTKLQIKSDHNYKGKYNPAEVEGVLVQFRDEGAGICETDIHNLFKRFFRSETVSNIPGTGLGLAIARDLARLHQGETYVESVCGEGSTFFVFLPRLRNATQIV